MPVIVLLRHGTSSANTAGILAGRSPNVSLTEDGAEALRRTLALLPRKRFERILHSPLLRCVETADIAASLVSAGSIAPAEAVTELDYGHWTGRRIEELRTEPLWETVLEHASRVRFPGGESIAEAARRAVDCLQELIAELVVEESVRDQARPLWGMIVSHGDIIKALIAEALGLDLDAFQRLSVAPGSFTVLDFSGRHPVLTAMSVTAEGMASGAVPGGGAITSPR